MAASTWVNRVARGGLRGRLLAIDSAALFLANVAFLITGLVRVKLTSVALGPNGIGMISQLTQVSTVVVTIGALGLGTGTRLALSRHTVSPAERAAVGSAIIRCASSAALALFLVAELKAGPLATALLGSAHYAADLRIALTSVPLSLASQLFIPISQSAAEFRRISLAALATAVVGSIITAALVLTRSEHLASASIPAAAVVQVAALAIVSPSVRAALQAKATYSGLHFKELIGIGLMSFLLAATDAGGEAVVRYRIVHLSGLGGVALYQPLYVHSRQVFGLLFGAISTAVMVHLNRAVGGVDRGVLEKRLNVATRQTIVLVALLALGTQCLAAIYVSLLFDARLLGAVPAIAWQTLGETLRSASWTLGAVLLPLGLKRQWLFAGMAVVAVRTAVIWLLEPAQHLDSVPIATAIAWAVSLMVTVVAIRGRGLRILKGTWLILFWTLAALSLGAIGVRTSGGAWAVSASPILVGIVWAFPLVLTLARRLATISGKASSAPQRSSEFV